MEAMFSQLDEIQAVGIKVRTTNAQEMNLTTAKIPGLWNRFLAEGLAEKISNQAEPGKLMGIYTNYESDHRGEYDLIISSEVSNFDDIPEGMSAVTIPKSDYQVFNVQGQMPHALIKAWAEIWDSFPEDSEYERLYTADFELYKSDTEVDVHIAVKRK